MAEHPPVHDPTPREEPRFPSGEDGPTTGRAVNLQLVAGLAALGIVPILLIFDSLTTYRQGWVPIHGLDWTVAGLIALWAAGSVIAIFSARIRSFSADNAIKLCVLVVSILLMLAGGEAALARMMAGMEAPFHHQRPFNVRHYVTDLEVIRGIHGESTLSANSRGIRGPELDDAYERKVLCIGGSTTMNFLLDDSETWSQVMMTRLNEEAEYAKYWVGNVGKPGFATPQHLRYVLENPDFGNLDVAVFLTGANDLLAPLNYTAHASLRDTSPLAAVQPRWRRSGYFRITEAVVTALMPSVDERVIDGTEVENFILRRTRRSKGTIVAHDGHAEQTQQVMLQKYARNIRGIIETCRARSVQPVFANQPSLWRSDQSAEDEATLWMGRLRRTRVYLSPGSLRIYMDQYNQVLRDVCAESGVPYVDLAAKMDGQSEYFWDDCHLTEAGARVVGIEIAQAVVALDRPDLVSESR